ncbi:MAG: extracellular solute-binding protein [Eubacteriales bacterium]|nr:extracellular solute-binding protein [Eubacteriales bacterium]
MKLKKYLATSLACALVLPLAWTYIQAEEADDEPETEDSAEDIDEESEVDEDEVNDGLFEVKDLQGITLRYLNAGRGSELNPGAADLKPEDVEERQEFIDELEKKWNVKLEFPEPPNVEWKEVPDAMAKAHAAGAPIADIMDLSRTYLPKLVRNNAIEDMTDVLSDHQIAERYLDIMTFAGKIYGVAPFVGGEGLYYNRKMINDAGMEKTPSEMFVEGKWSYSDFLAYLEELSAKLPKDSKPFYIDPYYWMIFAPAANGGRLIDTDGKVHYTDPSMIETLDLLVQLKNKGLLFDPIKDEKGDPDYWSTPAQTFEKGSQVAMCHRASWQAEGLVDKIEFGFVPYPWGDNIKLEATGEKAYLELPPEYQVTVYDGAAFMLRAGIEELGNKADIMDFLIVSSGQSYMRREYFVTKGEMDPPEKEYDPRFFSNELDVELFDWSLSRERFEPYPSLAGNLELADKYYEAIDGKSSVRAILEAQAAADQAALDKIYGRSADEAESEASEK